MEIVVDPDVAAARRLAREVDHAVHKMHAFVRFKRVEHTPETFVAWFEPPHRVIERGVDYFVKRMANVRFSILSPETSAHWEGTQLTFGEGPPRPPPSEDALEDTWRAYYASIFNPARVNPKLTTQHMPRRYWRNLPEATVISDLTRGSEARARAMVQSTPTTPSPRALRAAARASRDAPADTGVAPASLEEIAASVQVCRRCELWRDATQDVPGEGPARARLMFVGEQPGDQGTWRAIRLSVRPGRLGQGAGRGRRPTHGNLRHQRRETLQAPGSRQAAHPSETGRWRGEGLPLVAGQRASPGPAEGGGGVGLDGGERRSGPSRGGDEGAGPGGGLGRRRAAFVTVHPSMLLRIPDQAAKRAAYQDFVRDLQAAWALVGQA